MTQLEEETKVDTVKDFGNSRIVKSGDNYEVHKKEGDNWVDATDENGEVLKLNYRKAKGGETGLYSLLRKLVNCEWKRADLDDKPNSCEHL